VPVHATLYEAVVAGVFAFTEAATFATAGAVVVGGFGGEGGATKPSMVSASTTSCCTTVHEIRPNPPFAHPVPHEFWMMRPVLS